MGGHHDTVAPMRIRFAAWLVTGPLGHLWAGVADWAGYAIGLLRGSSGPRSD
jgi:hypothetical protein